MEEKLICPYCTAWVDFDTEDKYQEDEIYEAECTSCDKRFGVTASISWRYYEQKVDCWNTGKHVWKNRVSAPRKYAVGRQACEDCGEERKISTVLWEEIEADPSHIENWRSAE